MLLPILIYSIPAILVYVLIRNYLLLPNTIPGPFLARFTNLYRLLLVSLRSPHEHHLRLHRQFGPVVRLGPNNVSVSGSSKYVTQIYGIGKGFVKSDFYSCFQNVVNGRRAASLVAMTDETEHAKSKRLIAHAYSLSILVEYEELVDRTIQVFLATLQERFCLPEPASPTSSTCTRLSSPTLDLCQYLQFFAFDVIGELTFSHRLGFIESGTDVDGIMAAIGANFEYFSVLGQMPWLDEAILGKNPIYVRYFRNPVSSPILRFAQRLLRQRLAEVDSEKSDGTPKTSKSDTQVSNLSSSVSLNRPDFLSRFLKIQHEQSIPSSANPSSDDNSEALMSDSTILSNLFMNINAGSDTIASTLRAIFYHLLKNPSSLEALRAELDAAADASTITTPCPTWAQTQNHLPYLCATVKEGLRLNPALSLPLERVVPSGGLTLVHDEEDMDTSPQVPPTATSTPQAPPPTKYQSTYLPPGTIVGINPWVHHRHTTRTFGHDADTWNPNRWLTNEEKSTKKMEHAMLAFGAGKRSCLGKNIALLELHKVVAALVLRFDIELVSQDKDWTVRNAWALSQTGIDVRIRRRQ
ncbi:hypothetical protein PV10_08969 [Exophiala mesophila]|uniref:Cytochrome P450 n=1 Tax=Exophiala mesophila TaxID=212818 RepID=A0A0D1Z2C9_EXOME|nr:uncharacterized protein PV10_08969 [Exophiala mesophila]KIV88039.1 hypothetical protein PV10_08969 [Exophiala mesophila]